MPEPVFGEADRVQSPVRSEGDLPQELRGKSPVEIAQYYQNREKTVRTLAQQAIDAAKTPTTPTHPTTPTERPMTATEIASARNTLIATAKREASQGKKYWNRLIGEIEKIMANVSPEQQVDSATWDTAYNSLVGANLERLQAEDREADATAQRIASERAQAAAAPAPTVEPLPEKVTKSILPGLEINEAQYRASDAMLRANEQPWPITMGKGKRQVHDAFKEVTQ